MTAPAPGLLAEDEALSLAAMKAVTDATEEADVNFMLEQLRDTADTAESDRIIKSFRKQMMQVGHSHGYMSRPTSPASADVADIRARCEAWVLDAIAYDRSDRHDQAELFDRLEAAQAAFDKAVDAQQTALQSALAEVERLTELHASTVDEVRNMDYLWQEAKANIATLTAECERLQAAANDAAGHLAGFMPRDGIHGVVGVQSRVLTNIADDLRTAARALQPAAGGEGT